MTFLARAFSDRRFILNTERTLEMTCVGAISFSGPMNCCNLRLKDVVTFATSDKPQQ